ncbi:MAG: hypothetical protein K2P81_01915 [Bacteriovoracaceae bacterium]|nr:hypothetical protein [Bacteriovoracaceae bacterium]
MKMFLVLSLLSSSLYAGQMRTFATDGCTMAPDGTVYRRGLWHECCVAHDLRFWGGGTKEERILADKSLKQCVTDKAGVVIANLFFAGVRAGSASPWKIPSKKWGNAWFDLAGYRKLSEIEIQELMTEVMKLDLKEDIRNEYLLELENRLKTKDDEEETM